MIDNLVPFGHLGLNSTIVPCDVKKMKMSALNFRLKTCELAGNILKGKFYFHDSTFLGDTLLVRSLFRLG